MKSTLQSIILMLALYTASNEAYGFSGPIGNQIKYNESQQIKCDEFLKQLPQEYRRGRILVPEDYKNPNGKQIEVFWFTRIKDDQVPVAWINGYGFPNHGAWTNFEKIENRLGLGFVYIDQRGYGCSSPFPIIVNSETARRQAFYSAEYIARDHEQVRKLLFGETKKWKIIGQSFGGFVVERYLTLFPNKVLDAYNIAGVPHRSNVESLALSMKSQIHARKRFFDIFPGVENDFFKLLSRIRKDSCVQIGPNGKLCGYAVIALVERNDLIDDSSYGRFNNFIRAQANCYAPSSCLVDKNGFLNQKFIEENQLANPTLKEIWWGDTIGALNLPGLQRQDKGFIEPNVPDYNRVCKEARKLLSVQGVHIERDLIYSECDLLEQVYSVYEREDLYQIFKDAPVRSLPDDKKLSHSIRANPNLKYYIYTGGLDVIFGMINQNIDGSARNLPKKQVINKHFPNRGHFLYNVEPSFWEDVSGKPFKKFSTSSLFLKDPIKGTVHELSDVGNFGGTKLRSSSDNISANAVYVGLANDPLDDHMRELVKGKIAIVDRGIATFKVKADNVIAAGAVGIILVNLSNFPAGPIPLDIGFTVGIPGVTLSKDVGDNLKRIVSENPNIIVEMKYTD